MPSFSYSIRDAKRRRNLSDGVDFKDKEGSSETYAYKGNRLGRSMAIEIARTLIAFGTMSNGG